MIKYMNIYEYLHITYKHAYIFLKHYNSIDNMKVIKVLQGSTSINNVHRWSERGPS